MRTISRDDFQSIESRYKVGEQFLESFSSFGYKAHDIVADDEVLLLVSRYLHDPHGTFATRFPARQKKIAEVAAGNYLPRNFAIAHNGLAYIVLPAVQGRLLSEIKGIGAAAEDLFHKAVLVLKQLHYGGVTVGDFSDRCFLVDDNEELHFLGSFGYVFEKIPGVRDEFAQFLAPEQFASDRHDIRSDIFSLGVIGYRLFTGHFIRDVGTADPLNNPAKNAPAPSSYDSQIAPWIDVVIGGCLAGDRQQRFASAVLLDEAIFEGRQSGLVPGGVNPWLSRTVVKQSMESKETSSEKIVTGSQIETRKMAPLILMFAVAAILVVFIISVFASGEKKAAEIVIDHNELIATLLELAPQDLKSDIASLEDKSLPATTIIAVLEKVAQSDSPVVNMILLSAIRSEIGAHLAELALIKDQATRLYTERLKNQGLVRTSVIWKNWFATVSSTPAIFDPMGLFEHSVKAIDFDRDAEARRGALQAVFDQDAEFAILLATAIVLDNRNGEAEKFRQLAKIFLQSRNIPNSRGRSVEEMVLVHDKTAVAFASDSSAMLKELKNGQLGWVLKSVIAEKSKVSFELLDEVLRRDIVPPYQKIFLEPLVGEDRKQIPDYIVSALMAASLGDLSLNVLQNLATWGGKSFERVFLSFAAITSDSHVSARAIQVLGQRVIISQPAKTLVAWIQKQTVENREGLAKAIGILSLIDIASEEEISYAFDAIMSQSGGRELFTAGMASDSLKLQREVMERIGPIMPFDDIVPLLRHVDPSIRIFAVKFLAGTNNVIVLNEVTRGYERETDPEVRAAYEQLHWTVQQRKN